mgnify:CR=1 FL=1
MTAKPKPVFAIVAGEASGDTLGADLICSLKKHFPDAIFEGIGGSKMQAEGFSSLFPMDRLSVMGFVDPLKRLPELLRIRRFLIKRYRQNPPVAFIGIDAPDFNLTIEYKLRISGVVTVHYVSPSVWAWRSGRIKKIKRSVDLMLTLFPFESRFYQQHDVSVCYVGHPLANQFGHQPQTMEARHKLELDLQRPLLCLMPGSRAGEVEMLADLFLDTAEHVKEQIGKKLQIVIPAANRARYEQLQKIVDPRNETISLLYQQSHLAMEAADVVLLASGTTALEAMLLKKPMVVSYRIGALTYRLVSPFIKTPFVSIPNLLANKMLVPELIQDDATVENLSAQIVSAFEADSREDQVNQFYRLHEQLTLNSGDVAAAAIVDLIEGN